MFLKKYREALLTVLAVAFVYGIFHILGIGCPIKYVTGISCAGCGMTRAYLALLRLDFAAAFSYHPLFILPPIALLLIVFKEKISKRLYYSLWFTIIGAFLIIYVLRILDVNDTVVVFEPKQGLIYRVFDFMRRSSKYVLQ